MIKANSLDSAPTAIELVRMAMAAMPAEEKPERVADLTARIQLALATRDTAKHVELVAALAQVGAFCALQIPDERRETFLSLLAGAAEE